MPVAVAALRLLAPFAATWSLCRHTDVQSALIDTVVASLSLPEDASKTVTSVGTTVLVKLLCRSSDATALSRVIARAMKSTVLMSHPSQLQQQTTALIARCRALDVITSLLSDAVPRAVVPCSAAVDVDACSPLSESDAVVTSPSRDGAAGTSGTDRTPQVVRGGAAVNGGVVLLAAGATPSGKSAIAADVPCTSAAFATLVQHMCVGVPERAEPRGLAVEALLAVVNVLPVVYQRHFVRFLVRFGKNRKPLFRQFAIEVAVQLLLTASPVLSATSCGQTVVESPSLLQVGATPVQGLRYESL